MFHESGEFDSKSGSRDRSKNESREESKIGSREESKIGSRDRSKNEGRNGSKNELCNRRNDYQLLPLLQELISVLERSAGAKGLEVCLNIEEGLPSGLTGDEDGVKQLMLKLIGNAVKYTERGRVTLSIQGVWSDRGGFRLKLSVADTGAGISQESAKPESARKLANGMQGTFRVQSVFGKGTLITVFLPQEICDSREIGTGWREASGGRETGTDWRDEPDGREVSDNREIGTDWRDEPDDREVPDNREIGTGWREAPEGRETPPLLNRSLAMTYCGGDEELGQEMLRAYCSQGEKYQKEIPGFVESGDWDNYRIVVHAIKSTSMSIGAEALSLHAKEQEDAAREGRVQEIVSDWKRLLAEHRLVLEAAADLIEKKAEGEAPERTVVSAEEYAAACEALLELVEGFEMSEALEQLEKLRQMAVDGMPADAEETLQKIGEALDNFAYDEAEGMLRNYMELQRKEG